MIYKINLIKLIAISSALLISSIFFAPIITHYPILKDLKYFFFFFNITILTVYIIKNNSIIILKKRDKEIFLLFITFYILFLVISILHYSSNNNFIINFILLTIIYINFIYIRSKINFFILFSKIVILFLILYLLFATYNLFHFILYKSLVFNFYSLEYYRLNNIFRLGMGLEDPNFISVKILVGFFLSHFILKNKFIDYIFLFFMIISLSTAFMGIIFLFLIIENYKKIFKIKYIFILFLIVIGIVYFVSNNELIMDILTRKFVDGGNSTGKSSLMVSIESRLEQYIIGIKVLAENVFGIGANNFVTVATNYILHNESTELLNLQGYFHDFHNTFFQLLIGAGVLPFVLFILMMYFIYKNLKIRELKIFFLLFILGLSTINASNVLQFWLLLFLLNFIPNKKTKLRVLNE